SLGIVRGLVAKPNDAALMMAVEDTDQPVCAAIMTPPFKLVLSSGTADAVAPLVEHLRVESVALPGVMSLAAMADAFAAAWGEHHAGRIDRLFDVKLLALGTAPAAAGAPGALRAATTDDIRLLREWGTEFFAEVGFPASERDSFVADLGDRIAVPRLWLWENGGPVCMLGHTETTARTARIGPVFTPRGARGQGYATAAVSELTRRLLAGGRTWCLLFADVGNPTSMGMYRRIGYAEVCLFREYRFGP
ncbi:MAG: GNAT family N-acetyltransferase, partial [Dongiaceae bacterium]